LMKIDIPYDVIGGTYLKKNIHWDMVGKAYEQGVRGDNLNYCTGGFTAEFPEGSVFDFNEKKPIEVSYLGAGFMMIPRATFEMFKENYSDCIYGGGTQTLYFQSEIQDDKYVSEDVAFCNMIRDIGGKIYVCPWMKLGHFGNHVYGGGYETEFL
jgi:hypothetical protein